MLLKSFFKVRYEQVKKGVFHILPEFINDKCDDLMCRGGDFYAVYNEETGLWSNSLSDVVAIVDNALFKFRQENQFPEDAVIIVKALRENSTGIYKQFINYVKTAPDNYRDLNQTVIFSDKEPKRTDYATFKLDYPFEVKATPAYDELMNTLYAPSERQKLEWAIGAIVQGDSKKIQKFIALYGDPGSGKSTIINIITSLFGKYATPFNAKALASASNQFGMEPFKNAPLVAYEHDSDLRKITDNSKLNSIISHEPMDMNEKHKAHYMITVPAFLFIATNSPIEITDVKSGLIRRLIDVEPTGEKLPEDRYFQLMDQIQFERGGIIAHCLDVYNNLGKKYYSRYTPVKQQERTDHFYDFMLGNYNLFKKQDYTTLKQAYDLYKVYISDSGMTWSYAKNRFKEELNGYFETWFASTTVDGQSLTNVYKGFKSEKFDVYAPEGPSEPPRWLQMTSTVSLLDSVLADCQAQYGGPDELPERAWDNVVTRLRGLDTTKLHYVRTPLNHIVIDFDLRDTDGNKNAELNLEAASKFPPTYGEFSKGGAGVHLHYTWDGDPTELAPIYAPGIEIKVFKGKSALRRRLSYCNDLPIAHISTGLPRKGVKPVVEPNTLKTEKSLRELIKRNLRKEIHPATKPSIDFIKRILDDAYANPELAYDVSDMRGQITSFAAQSSHNAAYCLKQVNAMKWKSERELPEVEISGEKPIVFYDVEVFPNLFVVCWKYRGANSKVVKMINPTPADIEFLFDTRLIGFNNRRYDNHILYARHLGESCEELFKRSQGIINDDRPIWMFPEAYSISYTDIYDFSSKKQSLKKFEIDLHIHHHELGLPWDQPVPEELWDTVADYCVDDVLATEAVFDARAEDFVAREFLAKLSGLTVNDTNRKHIEQILFGNDKHPQDKFVYTDLSTLFPGYTFENGKSMYRGFEAGEGGFVFATPGMHEDVALLDIASMHPTSLEQLNLFGPYTQRFSDIKKARIAIKHHDYDTARTLLDGALAPFLENITDEGAKALAYALKIIINSVYGLTAARFDTRCRDPRNIDNIVAKRGALFMINLKYEVEAKGFTVAHIKTDSIKIPNATPEIIQFVMDYGRQYGYEFEHEATYKRMCLVNDAVYIAQYTNPHPGEWTATGAQFQVPYVFKKLFSGEPIEFYDLCEARSVSDGAALYLDNGNGDMQFVGKAGLFCPMLPGCGAGNLVRVSGDKVGAATGCKDFLWMESEKVEQLGLQNFIDYQYFENKVDESIETISQYCDFNKFIE